LIDRIEKRVKDARRDITLGCRLIVRESTDPRAGAKPFLASEAKK